MKLQNNKKDSNNNPPQVKRQGWIARGVRVLDRFLENLFSSTVGVRTRTVIIHRVQEVKDKAVQTVEDKAVQTEDARTRVRSSKTKITPTYSRPNTTSLVFENPSYGKERSRKNTRTDNRRATSKKVRFSTKNEVTIINPDRVEPKGTYYELAPKSEECKRVLKNNPKYFDPSNTRQGQRAGAVQTYAERTQLHDASFTAQLEESRRAQHRQGRK